jgi:Peptidase C39 family
MAEPIEVSTKPLQELVASCRTAISCLVRLSAQNGADAQIETALKKNDRLGETIPLSRLVDLAGELGLQAKWIQVDWQGLKTAVRAHPLLIVRKNADVVVVTGGGRSGTEEVSVWDPHHDGVVFFVAREEFERAWNGHALIITPEDADVFQSPTSRKTAPTNDGKTSPASPDILGQRIRPDPPRTARVSRLSHPKETARRSLGLTIGLAATTIVAAAGIVLFLLTSPGADRIADSSAPATVEPAAVPDTLTNSRGAATSVGAVATAPVVPTAEAESPSSTPPSGGPTRQPDAPRPLGAPAPGASPLAPAAERAPSTLAAPAAQMQQAPVGTTTALPDSLPTVSVQDITALLGHGDTLFRKGDLAAARLFYERAADAGNGQAAIRLGETFDPVFLDHAQLRGARGDMGKALVWYRRARDLGAAEAEVLLEALEAK